MPARPAATRAVARSIALSLSLNLFIYIYTNTQTHTRAHGAHIRRVPGDDRQVYVRQSDGCLSVSPSVCLFVHVSVSQCIRGGLNANLVLTVNKRLKGYLQRQNISGGGPTGAERERRLADEELQCLPFLFQLRQQSLHGTQLKS